MKSIKRISLFAVLLAAFTTAAGPYPKIVKLEYKDGQAPRVEVKTAIRQALPDKYPEFEANLIATLQAPNCTECGKRFCFQLLRIVGGKATVTAAAPYLADDTYSASALYAVEAIKCDELNGALRVALAKSKGKTRIGLVSTLGFRRDPKAVSLIAPLLKTDDRDTVFAALQALGNIGTPEAAQALRQKVTGNLATKRTNSLLICAQRLVDAGEKGTAARICAALLRSDNKITRIGALSILGKADAQAGTAALIQALMDKDPAVAKAAARFMVNVPGSGVTTALANSFPKLSPELQLTVLGVFAARKDKAAVPAVRQALKSSDNTVADEALVVLGQIGGPAELDTLISYLPRNKVNATRGISMLEGADVDKAIIAKVLTSDENLGILLVNALKSRGASSAVPGLLQILPKCRANVAKAIGKALVSLATSEHQEAMVKLMCSNSTFAKSMGQAILAVARRTDDPVKRTAGVIAALGAASGDSKAALIRICAAAGGQPGLKTAAGFVTDADANLADAAVRGMSAYPDDDGLPVIAAACEAAKTAKHKILLCRAFLQKLEHGEGSTVEKVALTRRLAKAVKSDQEQKSVLWKLPTIACPQAMKLAEDMSRKASLAADAKAAMAKIKAAMTKPNMTASHKNEKCALAFDGKLDTRWSPEHAMRPGEWIVLDLKYPREVKALLLDCQKASNDYPRKYDVLTSDDGKTWKKVMSGQGTKSKTRIAFKSPIKSQYIKIVQQGKSNVNWWSINELIIED